MFSITFLSAFNWDDGELISYYRFDQSSGLVIDEQGNFSGTVAGSGMIRGTDGLINKTFNYSGTGYVTTGLSILSNNAGSISTWFRTKNTSQIQAIINTHSVSHDAGIFIDAGKISFNNQISFNLQFTPSTFLNDTWYYVVGVWNSTETSLYFDGVKVNSTTGNSWDPLGNNVQIGSRAALNDIIMNGSIDEMGIWERSLSSQEITELYNNGNGLTFGQSLGPILIAPDDNLLTFDNNVNFKCNSSDVALNLSLILNDEINFTVTNSTPNQILSINETVVLNFISYNWSCNSTDILLNETQSNIRILTVTPVNIINISFEPIVLETSEQTFIINVTTATGFNIQSATLIYNGTTFSPSIKTILGGGITKFQINITIATGQQGFISENRTFFWNVTVNNEETGESSSILSSENDQIVNELNFGLCGGILDVPMLNFTMFNEVDGTEIVAGDNATTFQATFNIGSSINNLLKNLSINNISVATNEFDFCTENENNTIFIDMELFYTAEGFSDKRYFIEGGTLTNNTNEISLFLLPSALSIEFFITVERDLFALQNAIIQIQKFIIGEGLFKTVDIQKTDGDGKIVSFLDLNKDYRFTVIKDSEVLIIDDKSSICESAPCELKIQIGTTKFNLLSGLENFAGNVLYNISYNVLTKIVTFDFVDVTGLATSFRMIISKLSFTSQNIIISDQELFTSAGTMTFNMSGESGDFIVKVFISRSPFLIIDIFSFIINDMAGELGLIGLLFAFLLILTIIFGIALKPSLLILSVPIALMTTKFMGIISIGWTALTAILILAAISFFALER